MTSEPPTVWEEAMESDERIRAVADQLTRPRSASWVAEQAQVNYKTARKYLDKLVEDDRLLTAEEGQTTLYSPNPREQFFGEIGTLVDEHTKEELTAELAAIGDRIGEWQASYGVEDADELRTTLDESLSVAERRERERIVDRWRYSREMRRLIRHAIRLYDDLQQYTIAHTSPPAEAATNE
jgi:hypothetical protein